MTRQPSDKARPVKLTLAGLAVNVLALILERPELYSIGWPTMLAAGGRLLLDWLRPMPTSSQLLSSPPVSQPLPARGEGREWLAERLSRLERSLAHLTTAQRDQLLRDEICGKWAYVEIIVHDVHRESGVTTVHGALLGEDATAPIALALRDSDAGKGVGLDKGDALTVVGQGDSYRSGFYLKSCEWVKRGRPLMSGSPGTS